jgi:3-oxoacid CoA-transferase subunit A
VGTIVADGKPTQEFDGKTYVMERGIVPEVSLVKAYMADTSGNLRFRRTARNFNPNVAMAGKITVVEVEKIVEKGAIDPDDVHLPGIFVHRIVLNATPRSASSSAPPAKPEPRRRTNMAWTRDEMAARAAKELQDGST